jgi:hypothetical protein
MCQMGSCVGSSCTSTCDRGNTCINGSCVCKGTMLTCMDPLNCCEGVGCVDFETDPNNCGGCGHGCAGDQQCCGAKCIPLGDPANCGHCGNVCSGGTSPDGGPPPLGMCCPCNGSYSCGAGGKCLVCVGGGGTGGTGGGPGPL